MSPSEATDATLKTIFIYYMEKKYDSLIKVRSTKAQNQKLEKDFKKWKEKKGNPDNKSFYIRNKLDLE